MGIWIFFVFLNEKVNVIRTEVSEHHVNSSPFVLSLFWKEKMSVLDCGGSQKGKNHIGGKVYYIEDKRHTLILAAVFVHVGLELWIL